MHRKRFSFTMPISPRMCLKGFLFVDKDINNPNKNNAWWKPAVEIFSRVSGSIIVPVVLALIIGKYLDNHFGTKPWIFLGLTLIAFIISSYSIIRTVSLYMKKIEEENKK